MSPGFGAEAADGSGRAAGMDDGSAGAANSGSAEAGDVDSAGMGGDSAGAGDVDSAGMGGDSAGAGDVDSAGMGGDPGRAAEMGGSERPVPSPVPSIGPSGEPGFYLFVYGTLRSGGRAVSVLDGCTLVGEASVEGTLYDMGEHPALMLYGTHEVRGEVWRCPADLLSRLDEYEGVADRLFRRVGLMAGGYPCWAYVVGPKLAHRLTPDRRTPCWPAPPV